MGLMIHECEFCETTLTPEEPANVALFAHLKNSPDCNEQFGYLIENIQTSWTPSMSGG